MAKNLMNLAKGGKKTPPAKKVAVKKVEKPISPAEERDIKAKARVEELLEGVQLTPEKKEELLELEPVQKEGAEWLEEQVTLLTEQNESLRSELALVKQDYELIFIENQHIKTGVGITSNEGAVKAKVIELFEEIQNNHIAAGVDPISNIGNFRIYCPGFLNRLIAFFPFLAERKRY